MPASHVSAALNFYHEINQLHDRGGDFTAALAFARRFEDLAQRVLSAHAAQTGMIYEIPPGLALAALRSYINDGPCFTADRYLAALPAQSTDGRYGMLADLAGWYAGGYSPSRPLDNSLQVWTGNRGDRSIRLYGPGFTAAPPAPFILLGQPPIEDWLPAGTSRPVALVAHYDVHGLAMLALTRRYLNQHGFMDVDCTLSFELTGDITAPCIHGHPNTRCALPPVWIMHRTAIWSSSTTTLILQGWPLNCCATDSVLR